MAYEVKVLNERALLYARDVVRSTTAAESGHTSTALSLVHVVSCLMQHMKLNPENPFSRTENDVLVLSEGHAVPVLYSAWKYAGVKILKNKSMINLPDLTSLRDIHSIFDGHPSPVLEIDDVEYHLPFACATGALGQGLSIANGISLADRLDDIKRRIYVVVGDSEIREGQYDEAARFAVAKRLPVKVILNSNKYGQTGRVDEIIPYNYQKEFEAKGWTVIQVHGHEVANIMNCLETLDQHNGPCILIADTIKGWGVSQLQQGNWHGKPLPRHLENQALIELESSCTETSFHCRETRIEPFQGYPHTPISASLSDFQTKFLSARKAYGLALVALGIQDKNIVVLDAEVSNSTFSELFRKQFPDRYVECGVAEQNMASVAAGLASQGKIVFVNSFARFLETAYSQFNIAFQSRLPLHIVGSHVGLGAHSDGPSQMGLSDVSYMLSFPNLIVLSPSDGMSAYKLTEVCANSTQPTYMRTFRPDMPFLYTQDSEFKIGGSHVLKKGKDVTIVSHGYMTHVALEAARLMSTQGIECTLMDAYCLKPFDAHTLLSLPHNNVLVIEDNFANGLGSLVAGTTSVRGSHVEQMHVARWPKSSRSIDDSFDYCGLSVKHIVERVSAMLAPS